jgi:hypothetical protein
LNKRTDYSAYIIVERKRDEKRSRERPRRKREDNINMDLKGIRYESVDWIHLAQTSAVDNTSPINAGSFFTA